MKNLCLVVIAGITIGGHPMHARCRSGQKIIRISSGTPSAGDTVAGPCEIIVRGLNVARYDYSFSSTVTFAAAPDLWSRLLTLSTANNASSAPATPAVPSAVPAPPSRADIRLLE